MGGVLGWVLVDELIEAALRAGVTGIRERIAVNELDAYLAMGLQSLNTERRDQLNSFLRQANLDTLIIHGFPRVPAQTPCLAIVLNAEHNSQFVGEQGYRVFDAPIAPDIPPSSEVTKAEQWESTIAVIVHAENGDLCRWLYHLAKFIMAEQQIALTRQNVDAMSMSGGDLQFAPQFLQAGRFVYRRSLNLTLTVIQHATFDDRYLIEQTVAEPTLISSHAQTYVGFNPPA